MAAGPWCGDRQAFDRVVNPLPARCPVARQLRSRNSSDTTNCLSAQGVTRVPIALTRPAETPLNGRGNAVKH